MSAVARGTPAGDAYLDLQKQARATGRSTNDLLDRTVRINDEKTMNQNG
jgi:hypothetical protein